MVFKRIIYALLYSKGFFYLSRNFQLQRVGNVDWLKNNFGFGETCDFIDELIIILVTKNPDKKEISNYFNDVKKIREKIFVPITLGGGIRNFEHAKECFFNGADKVLLNYLAHKNQGEVFKISDVYGEQSISLMVDYKNINGTNFSYINSAKDKSISLKEYFQKIKELKFGELIINSIEKDGSAQGIDINCFDSFPEDLNKPILLMGGAGKPEHFVSVLKNDKISGVVTANLFNFLGNGLQLARSFSLKKGVKLIKFDKL